MNKSSKRALEETVAEGWIKKVDFYDRVIVMGDQTRIMLDSIVDIESDVFRKY